MFRLKDIGKKQEEVLNSLHGDKVIWIIIFLLSLISIALIYSASSSLAFKEHTTNFAYLVKQLRFVALGILALYICYRIPLRWYRYLTVPLLALSIILLALTPIIGSEVNGAKRWLNIFGLTFQPTEMAKITIILYLARILEVSKIETYTQFLLKIVLPLGMVCILIMIGSVSQALLVALISLLILFASDVKFKYLLYTMGLAACTFLVILLLNLAFGWFGRIDTATSRLKKFVTDEVEQVDDGNMTAAEQKQKQADKTFQADMAKIAISSVGVLGKGPGKSTQRYVLPHPYSDYIYTIIIEEYGLLGGVFVLLLYLWFFYRCVMLVKNCKTVFSAMTVGGLGLLITIQAILHVFVNVGLLPVTGHTLPLVSLGGTSLIILSCAFGIILSVSRTKDAAETMKKKLAAAGNSVAGGGNEDNGDTVTEETSGDDGPGTEGERDKNEFKG